MCKVTGFRKGNFVLFHCTIVFRIYPKSRQNRGFICVSYFCMAWWPVLWPMECDLCFRPGLRSISLFSPFVSHSKLVTRHATLVLSDVHRIQSNIDAGLYSCGVFIDLKKAFNTVDHIILLNKLSHYGIRGIINDWLASYLTDRTQTTQVEASISSKGKILFGFPQVSVLGPLLFLIYVNDIYRVSSKLNFSLFADDTNILYANLK